MKESTLRNKMVTHIRHLPVRSWAVSTHQGAFTPSAGEPDIDAAVEGVALKIEVKLPGNRPTALQRRVIRRWREAGAVAGWADSLGHVDQLVAECLRRARGEPERPWDERDDLLPGRP